MRPSVRRSLSPLLRSKKSGTFLEQNKDFLKGSGGILSTAVAAHNRAKFGEEAILIEKKKFKNESIKATLQLFAMDRCCPVVRKIIMKKL